MSEAQEAQFKKVIDRLLDDNKALRDLVDWQAAENKWLREALRELIDDYEYDSITGLGIAKARAALEGKA